MGRLREMASRGQGAAEAVAWKQEVQGAPEDFEPSREEGVLGADGRGQLAEVGSRAAAREDEKMGFKQSPRALRTPWGAPPRSRILA